MAFLIRGRQRPRPFTDGIARSQARGIINQAYVQGQQMLDMAEKQAKELVENAQELVHDAKEMHAKVEELLEEMGGELRKIRAKGGLSLWRARAGDGALSIAEIEGRLSVVEEGASR